MKIVFAVLFIAVITAGCASVEVVDIGGGGADVPIDVGADADTTPPQPTPLCGGCGYTIFVFPGKGEAK